MRSHHFSETEGFAFVFGQADIENTCCPLNADARGKGKAGVVEPVVALADDAQGKHRAGVTDNGLHDFGHALGCGVETPAGLEIGDNVGPRLARVADDPGDFG